MLYLKNRPKTIQDLDNTHAKDVLKNILTSASKNPTALPHALLFIGQKGTGKTSSARIIAKAVNCQRNAFSQHDETHSVEPCNICNNCKSIDNSTSPDVLEMDAASNRGIDEIRSLIRDSAFAPISSRFRVYIIDEAHMITHDAFNALLKTLEEPPSSVIFILATTNDEKIPKTISSRCLKVHFGKARHEDIINMLQRTAKTEKVNVPNDVLEFIAHHAESSFRDATKMLEELIIQNKLELQAAKEFLGFHSKQNLMDILQQGTLQEALNWTNEYDQRGGSMKNLIEEVLEDLKQMLLSKSGVDTSNPVKTSLSISDISYLMKVLNEAYSNLRLSPVESIPLEIAIVEFYNRKKQA